MSFYTLLYGINTGLSMILEVVILTLSNTLANVVLIDSDGRITKRYSVCVWNVHRRKLRGVYTMSFTNPDEDDSKGYKSPRAGVPRISPKVVSYKIPLTEYNTCPCCEGKGYVKVIKDDEK